MGKLYFTFIDEYNYNTIKSLVVNARWNIIDDRAEVNLRGVEGIKNFSSSLFTIIVISFLWSSVKRLEYLRNMWNLPAENWMVVLLPNILLQQRLQKYVKCYKQERYINAELLCEETNVILEYHLKN
jgi:hypothetical protein